MKKRIIAILCTLALLIPVVALPASALASWTTYSAPTDIDYSFVVFGDMQSITWTDNLKGTKYVKSAFDWILNNRTSRKIEYVFGLGDTVDTLTTYSSNKVAANGKTQNVNEWELVSAQIHRLDGVIPYTITRGNHDDEGGYHKYICTEDYKEQMDGFYYDPSKPATLGNSMSNCYRKIEICGTKYLMLSIDYNADSKVIAWANGVIESNPEYRVIASVHAYLNGGYSGGVGALESENSGFLSDTIGAANADNSEQVNTAFSGKDLWDNLFSKHKNLLMVLCGHDAIPTPVHNVRTAINGNSVIELLVDTSKYDLEKSESYGANLMMLLNFREDTNEIQVEYFSPSRAQAGYSDYHLSGEQIHFTYNDLVDWEPIVKDLGLPVYVGAPMTVSPTLDGVATVEEYSYSKYYAPEELLNYSEAETQGGITEYIAHDADYIYYAVSVTQEADDRALKWQFNPLNTFGIFNDKTNLKTTLFQRVTWQLRYQSDGTTELWESPKWNYSMSEDLPVVGTDLTYAATKTADNLKTYEIRLSKAYLAEYNHCGKEDIKILPYMTIFHESTTISHNYTQAEVNTLKSYGATRADTGSAPTFMVLAEEHNWNAGVETTPATHFATGVRTYTCSGCGTTKTEVIPKTTAHAFGDWENYNSEQHKHSCACGEIEYAAHSWGNGVETTPATYEESGVKTYTCADCGATKTEIIAKLDAPETTVASTTADEVATTTANTTVGTTVADVTDSTSSGCNAVLSASALVMLPTLIGAAFVTRRKKDD